MEIIGDNFKVFFRLKIKRESKAAVFNDVWAKYHKKLLYFIGTMIYEKPEDILQDVMIKVYENLEKYNPLYSFNTWIYSIARNHCFNYIAKKRIQTIRIAGDDEAFLTDFENPEKELDKKESDNLLEQVLDKLSPEYKQMVFLHFYEDLNYNQIADMFNIPVGTVKSRFSKIKKELKISLEEVYE